MAEYGLNLWDYWRILHKRKFIILSVMIVSIISSRFFQKKTDPIYRSTVTISISSNEPIAQITGSGVTFWSGGNDDIETQMEYIKSFSIMKEVAELMGYVTPETGEEETIDIVSNLRSRITVEKSPMSELINITARGRVPREVKDLVENVTDVYIEKTLSNKIRDTKQTKEFIEQQLEKLDREGVAIRKQLRRYTGGAMMGPVVNTSDLLSIKARLVQLELELSNLNERYTDNYPRIQDIKAEMKTLMAQMEKIPEEMSEENEGLKAEDLVVQGPLDVANLENELEINQKLYGIIREKYERASLIEASKTSGIEIVNPAVLPKVSKQTGGNTTLFLGAVIGLILGFVAALMAESMDTSIGTIEDVEEYLRIPVLGVIPRMEITKKELETNYWKKPPPPEERKKYVEIMGRLMTQYKPKSPVAEAYRNLQTYIKFSGIDKFGNCLMFTSAGIQEGKTITSVNCALSMAQMGYSVLLIDADLRRPSVHKVFGIDRDLGLTEVILGAFKLEDAVKTIDDIMMGNIKSSMILQTYGMENLKILTTGRLPSNPTEILSSERMTKFIEEIKQKFQVIIIDSAPILPVTDSCILGSKVDGAILVYEVGRVSRLALRRSKIQIENAKGRTIGIVLNSMRASEMKFGSPFYYYYQKYYGEDEAQS